jgi:hypothetical protein
MRYLEYLARLMLDRPPDSSSIVAVRGEGARLHQEKIIADSEIAFAYWRDAGEPSGVGVLLIRGGHRLGEEPRSVGQMPLIAGVPCADRQEASELCDRTRHIGRA